MKSPTELAEEFQNACGNLQIDKIRELITEDFVYHSPTNKSHTAEDFIEMLKGFNAKFSHKIFDRIEQGDRTASLFDCTFLEPFQGTIRMSEMIRTKDGKITTVIQTFDPKEFPSK